MGTYDIAVYFWSLVVAGAVALPVTWAVVREAVRALDHLHEHGTPSHPSLISVPSTPGGR